MKNEKLFLSEEGRRRLIDSLRQSETRVVAPVSTGGRNDARAATEYRRIEEAGEEVLDGPLPRTSLKEFFLPPTEPLFGWSRDATNVSIEPAPQSFQETVVLGASPCDAAALPVLDRVMGWDYRDEPWFGRRKATTVISRACWGEDESCFCTAVGLSPDSERGADLLLVPCGEGKGHIVEILTEAGETLVTKHPGAFEPSRDTSESDAFRRSAERRVSENLDIDPGAVKSWLEQNFESDLWRTTADRCHGCGACASICPTCHCFDIVDEPEGIERGTRRRNWDTCQNAIFTLHGSGHNPRDMQVNRFRQRIMHKLSIYPRRFEEILCTGCGRCTRSCSAGMDLPEILREINRIAAGRKRETVGSRGAS